MSLENIQQMIASFLQYLITDDVVYTVIGRKAEESAESYQTLFTQVGHRSETYSSKHQDVLML